MPEDTNDGLAAAHDYRGQQQYRYGKTETFKFIESTKKEFDAAVAHVQIMFPDFTREKLVAMMNEKPGPETVMDEPIGHSQIQDFRVLIEQAIEKYGFPLHDGVSLGVLHGSGTEAMQQRVMMTNASVIMVTSNMLMLVHRVAKLLALSLPLTISEENFTPVYDLLEIKKFILADEQLLETWKELFFDYSFNNSSPANGRAVYVFGKERQTLWDDFSEAMSLFVVGHEYGHHIAQHSLGNQAGVTGENSATQHQKEFEADIYATLLSSQAGQLTERPNWFALTSVGAVVILTVLELIRRGSRILATGQDEDSNTRSSHPPLEERIKAIRVAAHHFCGDGNFEVALKMQETILGTVQVAWQSARDSLMISHRSGIRPVEDVSGGWLP